METEPKTRIVRSYDVQSHGVDGSSYFPGCGVSFTRYDDCATGIGNSEREALEDALDMLAQSGDWQWDAECPEPDPLEYSDVDDVTPIEEESKRDDLGDCPEPVYDVALRTYNGMTVPLRGAFETLADANAYAKAYAERAERKGQEVCILGNAPDDNTPAEWEIQWPGQGVGDDEGILSVEISNEQDIDAWHKAEERYDDESCSELHYFLTIRVSDKSEEN